MKISLQHPSNIIAGSHYLQQGTLHYITLHYTLVKWRRWTSVSAAMFRNSTGR